MLVRFARVLLVVALLAGWQGALVHPLAHVDEHGQPVHLGGKGGGDASCDVLAALSACAPSAGSALPAGASSGLSPIRLVAALRAAAAPPFLSQGPPAIA